MIPEFQTNPVGGSGVYLVSLVSESGRISKKVISTCAGGAGNLVRYKGAIPGRYPDPESSGSGLKTSSGGYSLTYTPGDIIQYRCSNGNFTTIVTDSPKSSTNYRVEFAVCTDPDRRNYSVVMLGEQLWMAENLAYLPAISPSKTGSDTLPHYYVYGYAGTKVEEAKKTGIFQSYGVLYNWTAAMQGASSSQTIPSGVKGICPDGWHLPSDGEWDILTGWLAGNGYGYGGSGPDIGKALASSAGWQSYTIGGRIGNEFRGIRCFRQHH